MKKRLVSLALVFFMAIGTFAAPSPASAVNVDDYLGTDIKAAPSSKNIREYPSGSFRISGVTYTRGVASVEASATPASYAAYYDTGGQYVKMSGRYGPVGDTEGNGTVTVYGIKDGGGWQQLEATLTSVANVSLPFERDITGVQQIRIEFSDPGHAMADVCFSRDPATVPRAVTVPPAQYGSVTVTGGSGGSIFPGDSVTLTATPNKDCIFTGWYGEDGKEVSLYNPYTFTVGNQDVKLEARFVNPFEYTVTYNANGGSGAPAAQTMNHGEAIVLSNTVPARANFRFMGWSASASSTDAQYQPGGTFIANSSTILYAVWAPSGNSQYTVSYNANGGTGAPSPQAKTHGYSLTLRTEIPLRSGYNFLGWSTGASDTTAQYLPGGMYSANAAATLYAVWAPIDGSGYVIRYDANGGTGAPVQQYKPHGIDARISSVIPARYGYTFMGWSASPTANAPQYQPGGIYTINAGAVLYAVWTATGSTPSPGYGLYVITYSANGGINAPPPQTKAQGVPLALNTSWPSRTGYVFLGWATVPSAVTPLFYPGGTYNTDASATLYAVWSLSSDGGWYPSPTGPSYNTYRVNLSENNPVFGSTYAYPYYAAPGDRVSVSASPNAGYVFDRWEVLSDNITLDYVYAPTASFIMPAGSVSARAVFIPSTGGGYYGLNPGEWYYDAMRYTASFGLFDLFITGNNLEPNRIITRAEFVVTFMNAFGINPNLFASGAQFDDVNPLAPYANYLRTAKAMGLIRGVDASGTRFDPNGAVTREQFFVLTHNFLSALNIMPGGNSGRGLQNFHDGYNVNDYARPAANSLITSGIIRGSNGWLYPSVNMTRKELSQAIYNLLTMQSV